MKRGPRRIRGMATKQSIAESSSNLKAPKRKLAQKNESNFDLRYDLATILDPNTNNDHREEHSE